MVKKKLCFVIMPFSSTKRWTSEKWTEIFANVHKPAITGSRFSYRCERSKIRTGAFIKDILTQLNQADVVLADLTDMNANVFYELGVRHTLRNRTILVSQTMDDVPSDLKQYGVIIYDTTPKGVAEYKNKIKDVLKDIRDKPSRSDNPISDYLNLKSIVTDPFEAKSIEKKLFALVSECSYNLRVIDSVLESLNSNSKSIPIMRFQFGALELLISTYYIYSNKNHIKMASELLVAFISQYALLDLLRNKDFRDQARRRILELYPDLRKLLVNFMKQSDKILKDFRNQNFIEPKEIVLCFSKEEYFDDLK